MSDKYNDHLKTVLTADGRLVDEQGDLMLNKIKDLVNNLDENLLDILLADDESRDKFFIKVKEIYVFKQRDFIFFLEQNSLDNSFTSYANRIGLTLNGKFLKDNTDVVLDFPYKDCVLEGGQKNDEGIDESYESETYKLIKSKRKEVFYNKIIAKDEVDRLFEPKAFVNIKKFDSNGESIPVLFQRDSSENISDNLVIKGNNLLALHSLKGVFREKVKLIYIDPPYNTGGSGDTFIYNNSFKRSSWLTFMKNRLEIAKTLLKEDGVLIAAIDDYEVHTLRFLLDEIFGNENRLGTVVVVHNPRGRNDDKYFATMHEYLLVYAKNKDLVKLKNFEFTEEDLKQFNKNDDISDYAETPFTRTGNNSNKHERPNLFYPIFFNPETNELSLDPKPNTIEILPINPTGEEKTWRWGKETFDVKKETELLVKKVKGEFKIFKKRRPLDVEGRKPRTVWSDSKYDASSNGIMLLRNILGKNEFSYPKSLYAVMDIIKILSDKNDVILDFFAGSGTTAHAVLELNKLDGGNRQFILCEQMGYVESVIVERVKKIITTNNCNSFVYLELAKNNQAAVELIQSAENFEQLQNLFTEIYDKYFLHYNVKIQEFKNKIIKEENFLALPLEKQKEMFIRMLDNNQLYVNVDDMEDARYGLNPDDIRLTKDFYQINE